ncbi:MAG: type III-B CRISPR-associated protein Cas10/Cmr2 [Verrucomicrobia bacterium]|nr:type III-B CRISPR-associated protein Cas10/Cmr2 [Verrucomicrobiota bacterium]
MNELWKSKLLAYLHDPPHKPFRIAGHETARLTPLTELGLTQAEMEAWQKQPDHLAAAADRFPFPHADVMRVDWKEDSQLEFRHPLAGERYVPADQPRERSSVGEQWVNGALKGIPVDGADEKAKFFRVWRLWPERCAREKHPMLAYLVADTRIPDHTLWHHNGVASALEAVGQQPAFLQFQIGPVQDFIRQARKLQDLWSGSYLLSFLISKALATVALELGPDCVIYPNLRGAPLLDWWWLVESRHNGLFPDDLFHLDKGRLHPNELLTPTLPNRFLALVPRGQEGQRIACAAEAAVRDLWQDIADKVHAEICARLAERLKQGQFVSWDHFWPGQVVRFPVIDWAIHPWEPENHAIEAAAANADPMPPLTHGWENHPLRHAALWRDGIPPSDREKWQGKRNDGFPWALHCAAADWRFAAVKNARSFSPWPQPEAGYQPPPKDHLNGRDEVLGGANPEAFWDALRPAFQSGDRDEFKGKQFYGALSVIKRLWPRVYLEGNLHWRQWKPGLPSVVDIAAAIEAEPEEWEHREVEPEVTSPAKRPAYYAVLCMDGDDMGQWISGVKTPPLGKVLADKAWDYFRQHWTPLRTQRAGTEVEFRAITELEPARNGQLERLPVQRPLGPGYHAALSEALSNFGLYCAGQVVEAFDGQIVYAGGDDLLAMVPAVNALDCANALQLAFRGELPEGSPAKVRENLEALFEFFPDSPGFLRCRRSGTDESQRPNWPLMVPGPRATASVGITIGHVHAPMQETIQAARDAEAAAKAVPGKGAFSLRILKRSGESAEIAAPWRAAAEDQGSVASVWAELTANSDRLSGSFPYRLLQLVRPLLGCSSTDADEGWEPRWTRPLLESVEAELRHVHYQQNESDATADDKRRRAREQAARWIRSLVGGAEAADQPGFKPALCPRAFVHFWMAWAFLRRLQPESKS